jgi:hypothetical protein
MGMGIGGGSWMMLQLQCGAGKKQSLRLTDWVCLAEALTEPQGHRATGPQNHRTTTEGGPSHNTAPSPSPSVHSTPLHSSPLAPAPAPLTNVPVGVCSASGARTNNVSQLGPA